MAVDFMNELVWLILGVYVVLLVIVDCGSP